MLDALTIGVKYIIDMGASVMIPVIIAILSIIVGVKPGKAIRGGLMIGVGFVGLGLIVGMLNSELGPAAEAMSQRFGLTLSVVDIGWPGMSPITWASEIAMIAIPVAVLVNVIMLLTRTTRVVNVDIWNVWHFTFTGAIAYVATGNYWIGMLGVAVHAVIAYKLGDFWAPICKDYYELDGITVPHGDSAYMGPYAIVVDWVMDRIPGIRDIDISADTLQEKIGVFGEPVVIGAILGTAIGFLAGYDLQSALPLGVNMAAVMILMPKIVKCIMDGLMPLTERAKTVMNDKFHGEEFYIGLDPAILLGDSQVIAAGLIFIPITLLLAVVIPGNKVLPFGDLATIGFFIAMAVAIHRGNLFRTLFSGTLIMTITIILANATTPWMSKLAISVGAVDPGTVTAALDQGGSPITYIFTQLFTGENVVGLAVVGITYALCLVATAIVTKKRKAELEQAND